MARFVCGGFRESKLARLLLLAVLCQMIETKMKKLLTVPPKVPLPSLAKILQNVPWIADNEDLVQFLKVPACPQASACVFLTASVSVAVRMRMYTYLCVCLLSLIHISEPTRPP